MDVDVQMDQRGGESSDFSNDLHYEPRVAQVSEKHDGPGHRCGYCHI